MLFGLKGRAGSGKDTVANYLVKHYGFTKLSFATAVKQICAILTGWSINLINGETAESRLFRETVVHPLFRRTCRQMLQQIGTELFRDHFDQDTWVKIVKSQIQELLKLDDQTNIVVTDVRFNNEAEMIQELGGRIVNINRTIQGETDGHRSEAKFQIVDQLTIDNDDSLDNLYAKVDQLVKQYVSK